MHPRRLTKLSTAILILLTSNPHVDGTTVPVQPWSVGKKVPMIFGSNQDEGALFALGTFQTANVSASQYSNFSTPTLDLQHPYAYFNSHTPSCQWLTSLPTRAIPYVGATHTSDVPFIFVNLAGLPLPGGNCTMNADGHAISESVIAAWSAMASTRNPSVPGACSGRSGTTSPIKESPLSI